MTHHRVSEAPGRLTGRVFERESGVGVPGLIVAARAGRGVPPTEGATTGLNGRFSVAVDGPVDRAAARLEVSSADDARPIEIVVRTVEQGRAGIVTELGVSRAQLGDASPTAEQDAGRRGRLRVRVVDENGKPVTQARRLLVAEHRSRHKRQVRAAMEGDGDFEVDVRAGTCSVQVVTRDHAVARRAVTVEPGQSEEFEIALSPRQAREPKTQEERLRRFDLKPEELKLDDLELKAGQRMRFDRGAGAKLPGFAELRPKSIGDFKRFVGTPDAVFGHEEPRFGPLPAVRGRLAEVPKGKEHYAQFSTSETKTLEHIALEYIHGNSASVSAYEPLLNAYLDKATFDIGIPGWFFHVVTINAGSVLELGTTQTVLTASKLRVHTTGRLEILGPSTIDIGEYEEFS